MQTLFGLLGFLFVIVYIVSTIAIYTYLKEKGEKASFLWLRIFMITYAHKYKRLTKEETGSVGFLFYTWILSINLALVCAILALFVF